MIRQGDIFVVNLNVPVGTHIGYGYWITEAQDGTVLEFWNGLTDKIVASSNGVTIDRYAPQQIRYYVPRDEKVFLVWGVNDWDTVPELVRPDETELIDEQRMHTPMERRNDTFMVDINMPTGSTLNYGFLVTEANSTTEVKATIDNEYPAIGIPNNVIGHYAEQIFTDD